MRCVCEIFGTSPQNTIGRSIYELDDGQWDLPEVSQLFGDLLRDGGAAMHDLERRHEPTRIGARTFHLNVQRLRRKQKTGLILLAMRETGDGGETGEATYRPLFPGAHAANMAISQITQREECGQQFLQRARLESIGILAGGIAHDFNNLLVGILGNAGLALSEAPPGSAYESALQDVICASQFGSAAAGDTRQRIRRATSSQPGWSA